MQLSSRKRAVLSMMIWLPTVVVQSWTPPTKLCATTLPPCYNDALRPSAYLKRAQSRLLLSYRKKGGSPSRVIMMKRLIGNSSQSSANSDGSSNNRHNSRRMPPRSISGLQRILHQYIIAPSPWLQLLIVLLLYGFHLTVLTQHQLVFPFQLIPGYSHHFVGMGYDSLVGVLTLIIYSILQKKSTSKVRSTTTTTTTQAKSFKASASVEPAAVPDPWPSLLSTPTRFPWILPVDCPITANTNSNDNNNNNNTTTVANQQGLFHIPNHDRLLFWNRGTFLLTTLSLIIAYFGTGRFSVFWEDTLYAASALGWPLTQPRFRALTVLLGHLSWVTIGTFLLAAIPAAPRFFTNSHVTGSTTTTTTTTNHADQEDHGNPPSNIRQQWRWFRLRWKNDRWLWWTIGGYLVSGLLFNMADLANHYILPHRMLEEGGTDSVVDLLVAPEHNDIIASVLGYIAPCITAPVWEELLYRGFLLPGLTAWTGSYKLAAVLQAIIFSAHHMSAKTALPLFVLGWTWAVLYSLSGNLWTVCLVHALWNSRVFLGGWLGL